MATTAGVFSIGGFGCSSSEVDENNPAALMKEAEEDISSSRYILALEKLQKIKNQHPYSKEAVDAQLRIADVYFLQENYAESAATYEAFRDLHPKHPKLAYAAYRVGLAFYSDLPGNHARDLSSGFKAQDAFKDYLAHFPGDVNVPDAQGKLSDTRKILAEKEMYIGNFYYKREMWEAARGRFNKVVNLYSDTSSYADAQDRLKSIDTKPPEKPADKTE
jgi:outer membrane protein assembly factor BamD